MNWYVHSAEKMVSKSLHRIFCKTIFVMVGSFFTWTLFCSFKSKMLVQHIRSKSSWHRHILTCQICYSSSVPAGKGVELATKNSNTLNHRKQIHLWSPLKGLTHLKSCSGNNYSPAQIVWGAQFQAHVLCAKMCVTWRLEGTVSTWVGKGRAKDVTCLGYWKVCDMIPNNIILSKLAIWIWWMDPGGWEIAWMVTTQRLAGNQCWVVSLRVFTGTGTVQLIFITGDL